MPFNPLITYVKLTKTITPDTNPVDSGIPTELKNFHLLQVVATDDLDDPAPIFVFQTEVKDPRETDPLKKFWGYFTNVASPADWQDFPDGIPDDDTVTMWRYHEISIICQSLEELNTIYDSILVDVQALVDHHKYLEANPGLSEEDIIN